MEASLSRQLHAGCSIVYGERELLDLDFSTSMIGNVKGATGVGSSRKLETVLDARLILKAYRNRMGYIFVLGCGQSSTIGDGRSIFTGQT